LSISKEKSYIKRRSFLKVTALAGGGLVINFSWLPDEGIVDNGTRCPPVCPPPSELNP